VGKPRVLLFVAILLLLFLHKPLLRNYFILEQRELIIDYSRIHQLNPALVSAMVFVESGFNPEAESHKGAVGLMQVMPATGQWVAQQLVWRDFTVTDLKDPAKNLRIGIWYLAYLKRNFRQNDNLALASYNAGSSYVSSWIERGVWNGDMVKVEQIPFPETKKYLIKVAVLKKVYRYLYPELDS
jgi:soluble lytic murein transglycosylase